MRITYDELPVSVARHFESNDVKINRNKAETLILVFVLSTSEAYGFRLVDKTWENSNLTKEEIKEVQ